MGSHIIDSELFGNQFSSVEMREVFCLEGMLKGWIDVEVALAKAESELGIVPEEAAQEIERKGRVERFDVPALRKGVEETWHPLVPFVREYKTMCDDGHGEYLHWGATTQDIVDTGAVLQTKQALGLIERDLLTIVASLCRMSRAHASITNRCVTSAVRNTPTAPAIGASTSPPKNARKPWFPLAPNNQVMPPGTSMKVRSPTRITEISMHTKANTNGLRRLPCRGSAAKKAVGWKTTRLTTSTKLLSGSERS